MDIEDINNYEAPKIEVIEVEVENGFAQSTTEEEPSSSTTTAEKGVWKF